MSDWELIKMLLLSSTGFEEDFEFIREQMDEEKIKNIPKKGST